MGRLLTSLGVGVGLLHIPSSYDAMFRFRTEALLEIFAVSSVEVIRMGWLIPARVALVIGYATFYRAFNFSYPWLQSLVIHGSGLLVRRTDPSEL